MSKMNPLITLFILAVFHQSALSQTNLRSNVSPFVEGKTIIDEVILTGFDEDLRDYGIKLDYPIYKTDFDQHLRGIRSQIKTDSLLDLDHVERIIVKLKSWLSNKGYVKAEVAVLGELISKDRMRLIFSVRRGPLVTIKEIGFIGSKSISVEEFRQDFAKCSRSDLKLFDTQRFDFYAQRCTRQLLYSQGFFKAKILSIDRKIEEDGYRITINVSEGDRYRLGKIVINGESVISEKEILEWLGMRTGDIADGRLLQKFVYETLKEKYGEKGHVQYNAEFDPEFVEPIAEGLDGTVNIQIFIEEGKQFTIRRIEFVGIESEEAVSLKNDFELKEGSVFVPGKLESGIDKINKTERFYLLDKDQHIEIRTDEEEGNLDLFISLRKIRP